MKLISLLKKDKLVINEGLISNIISKTVTLMLKGYTHIIYKEFDDALKNNPDVKKATDTLAKSIKDYKKILKDNPKFIPAIDVSKLGKYL